MPDASRTPFDLTRIVAETMVRTVDFHNEIRSTNTHALETVAEYRDFPVLVLAECQTAGRGRGAHSWWAGTGALTFSLVLDAAPWKLPAERWPQVSLATGLAVAEAVAQFLPVADVRLKWPNDLFIHGRKACGILVETSSAAPGILVVGIGLIVNNSLRAAPAELQTIATSLVDLAGQPLDRDAALIAVLQRLAQILPLVAVGDSQIAERWRELCYLHGRTVQIQTNPTDPGSPRVIGVCHGIDDDGGLVVQTESGIVTCHSGIVAKIL